MRAAGIEEHIRYEPDEWCPTLLSIGVAFQGVIIVLANIVLFVTIAFRAANLGDDYISWGITCSLIIGGAITILQAARLGRLGAAHILMSGASPHFIAVSVLALELGGILDARKPRGICLACPVRGSRVAPGAEAHHHPGRLRSWR